MYLYEAQFCNNSHLSTSKMHIALTIRTLPQEHQSNLKAAIPMVSFEKVYTVHKSHKGFDSAAGRSSLRKPKRSRWWLLLITLLSRISATQLRIGHGKSTRTRHESSRSCSSA